MSDNDKCSCLWWMVVIWAVSVSGSVSSGLSSIRWWLYFGRPWWLRWWTSCSFYRRCSPGSACLSSSCFGTAACLTETPGTECSSERKSRNYRRNSVTRESMIWCPTECPPPRTIRLVFDPSPTRERKSERRCRPGFLRQGTRWEWWLQACLSFGVAPFYKNRSFWN